VTPKKNIINYHILMLLQYVVLSFVIFYFWGRRCRARVPFDVTRSLFLRFPKIPPVDDIM